MKCLSLFSGIGAFEKALKNIGIDIELVGFSEIDKYAIKSYCAIHGVDESLNLGDISKIDLDELEKLGEIDLITHGSPCQDFSVAGLQAGGDKGTGTRSSLMWCTVDIVKKTCPKYVIWENVKNLLSDKHRHNFDSYIEVMDSLGYNSYYKVLNAKDYGIPQNRERVYTISIRQDCDEMGYEFPPAVHLEKKLKDILEDEVDNKYYLSTKLIEYFEKQNEKNKVKGNGFKWETTNGDCVAKAVTTRVGACRTDDNYIKVIGKCDIKGHDCIKRVYSKDGISPTLTDMQGGNRQPKIMVVGNYMPSNHDASRIVDEEGIAPTVKENHGTVTAVAMRGRYNTSGKVEQKIEISNREIANSITTVQKDSLVGEKTNIKPKLINKDKRLKSLVDKTDFEEGEVLCLDTYNQTTNPEVSQTLTEPHHNTHRLFDGYRIRKLTPRECFRLMGFSDTDFDKAKGAGISDTQLYKQAGNSIVVNVLEAIFKNLFVVKEKKSWYR